jgi:hypothetical protein
VENFITHVEQERLKGNNVILSDEAFIRFIDLSPAHLQHLLDMFANFAQVELCLDIVVSRNGL